MVQLLPSRLRGEHQENRRRTGGDVPSVHSRESPVPDAEERRWGMIELHPPFPWYGGKRHWADLIISCLGENDVYVEPFSGSLSVLLRKKESKREVVCDLDGGICNFWRALQHAPDDVARWADYPTVHDDLVSRQKWLIDWFRENRETLSNDPEYFDAKVAGWWLWGISIFIGRGWCDIQTDAIRDDIPELNHKLGGKGISRQRFNRPDLYEWMNAISLRLKDVVILNRSWESAVTKSVLGYVGDENLQAGILLDPPYKYVLKKSKIYSHDVVQTSSNVAVKAYNWAVENGSRPNTRIVYCCNEGDFIVPNGWRYAVRGFKGSRTKNKLNRDMIMFSPGCLESSELSESSSSTSGQSDNIIKSRSLRRGLRANMPKREGGV